MKRIRSVLLFYNSKRGKTAEMAAGAARFMASRKVAVTSVCVNEPCPGAPRAGTGRHCPQSVAGRITPGTLGAGGAVPPRALRVADAAVSVGGDGTALFAARHIVDKRMPLLGINAGGLGFLSGLEPRDLRAGLVEFLAGRFEVKPRSLLSAEVRRRGRRVFGPQPALNDCVLRASEARAFTLGVSCGREFLSSYFGDGMIISTPTGSTAYSLAAMGPIAHPSLDVFIINPICPHTLTHRPMVVPAGKPVTLKAGGVRAPMSIDLCLDGQESFHLEDGDAVVVRRYPRPLRLLVPPAFSWFEVLRRKLSWGER